jgi:hypothetical protein
MSRAEPTLRTSMFVLFGPIVWAVHFLILYGAHASICAAGDRLPLVGREMLPWLFAAATAAALLLVAAALLWPGALRRLLGATPVLAAEGLFLTRLMRALGILSSIGIAWAALAILLVPRCAPL